MDTLHRRHAASNRSHSAELELCFGPNAQRILAARYLRKDADGRCVEKPSELLRRVARTVAEAELTYGASEQQRAHWENVFYALMANCYFLPNSPTLMNAGRELGMLSACFVLPIGDSIEEIFDAIKNTALIQRAGGGTGFAFDRLRPTGDYIESSGGRTSGPISFWRAFSEATNAIQQGAFRRGANMAMMNVNHPDILKFLTAKNDLNLFTNYNVSVKIPDAWMQELAERPGSPHIVQNPRNGDRFAFPRHLDPRGYDIHSLCHVSNGSPRNVMTKQDLWDLITECACEYGEPGLAFIDRINESNPTPHLGPIESTNPCGEQPLLAFEACNLGSIDVSRFVRQANDSSGDFDWDSLRTCVQHGMRFLDNVVDANAYPLSEIQDVCMGNRKVGLGIMGFADTLFQLSVPYDSPEGIDWARRIMRFVNEEAHNYSEVLAAQRGAFPNWEGSVWQTVHNRRQRNACCTTVAPTGTISILAGCSGGIEPAYGLAFVRNVLREERGNGKPIIELNRPFADALRRQGLEDTARIAEAILEEGSCAALDALPEELRRVFVCAHDVAPDWHVRMQAAFQEFTDSAVSKTINLPAGADPKSVSQVYHLAHELGCKGITVYRDGCRKHQPMSGAKSRISPQSASEHHTKSELAPRDLPAIMSAVRVRQITPFGNMHVKITVDPERDAEQEVFAQLGRGGDLATSDLEAICRLASLWLRSGGPLEQVVSQLKGIGSSLQIATKEGRITSLADGLAVSLERYMEAKKLYGLERLLLGKFDASTTKLHRRENGRLRGGFKVRCPECKHGVLRFSEGCVVCRECGFSQC